jgi:16S rRNA (adenine(1408)-N(1))-methyltransferase
VLDIGTGDGAYVYKAARKDPQRFYIGLDANAENMMAFAKKASSSMKKGGLSNLLYVVASSENLPEELNDLVDHISILFPWGSLLRAVAAPEQGFLEGLRRLARPKATFKALYSYESEIERKVIDEFALRALCKESLDALKYDYRRAGFSIKWRMVPQAELKGFPTTTWAKRLAYGRPRPCVELSGFCI